MMMPISTPEAPFSSAYTYRRDYPIQLYILPPIAVGVIAMSTCTVMHVYRVYVPIARLFAKQ